MEEQLVTCIVVKSKCQRSLLYIIRLHVESDGGRSLRENRIGNYSLHRREVVVICMHLRTPGLWRGPGENVLIQKVVFVLVDSRCDPGNL